MSDLIPDDFDLHKARHAGSTTPPEKRKRCPECGGTSIWSKSDNWGREREYDTEYKCELCNSHFDDPVMGGRDE